MTNSSSNLSKISKTIQWLFLSFEQNIIFIRKDYHNLLLFINTALTPFYTVSFSLSLSFSLPPLSFIHSFFFFQNCFSFLPIPSQLFNLSLCLCHCPNFLFLFLSFLLFTFLSYLILISFSLSSLLFFLSPSLSVSSHLFTLFLSIFVFFPICSPSPTLSVFLIISFSLLQPYLYFWLFPLSLFTSVSS